MEKKGVPINNFFTIFEKALFQRGVEIILTVRRGERQRAMECGCGVFRAGRKGGGYRQGRSSVVRKPRQKDFAERSRVRRSFTKAQASRPWIHAALARVEHGRPLRRHMLPLCPRRQSVSRAEREPKFKWDVQWRKIHGSLSAVPCSPCHAPGGVPGSAACLPSPARWKERSFVSARNTLYQILASLFRENACSGRPAEAERNSGTNLTARRLLRGTP